MRGFNGGIWVPWDRHEISLQVIHMVSHFIHLEVRESDGTRWALTAVYAIPDHTLRSAIWDQYSCIDLCPPWSSIGNFNCTLHDGERSFAGGALIIP